VVSAAAADAAPDPDVRFDFEPLFETDGLMRWADLAICHMETPLGRADGAYGWAGRSPFGGNLISGPYEIATGVAAVSFDRCSTASNHAYDLGFDGVVSTLDALDAHGVSHDGTARSEAESHPDVFDVADVRVAHLSYTRYSNTVLPFNDWALRYASSPLDVVDDVAAVRAAGAEIVIVSVHLSWELQTSPIERDRTFAEELVEQADIDLVIHHGPHVVQPLEWVRGVPVFWSLGNFISGMGVAGTGRYEDRRTLDGLLASVTFAEQPDGSFTAEAFPVAICTDPVTRRVRHATAAMSDLELSSAERTRAAACLARTLQVVPGAR
jgi:poly-gamma-glutamate synthesis protein (capsule biosynthesis protein)